MPAATSSALLVVHGHRAGNAVAGRPAISHECVARVVAAEHVARTRGIEQVLFCGGGVPGGLSEARQMANAWTGPDVRVFLDERSTDSAENADEALAWAAKVGAGEIVVVSSWWHVRLLVYYRGRRFRNVTVRHARCWRMHHVAQHLCHELRYLPCALLRHPGP